MTSFRPWPSWLTTLQQRKFPAQSPSVSTLSPTLSAMSDRENLPTRKIKENAIFVEQPDTPVLILMKTDRSCAKLLGRFVQSVENQTISLHSASQDVKTPDKSLRLRLTPMVRVCVPSQPPVSTVVTPLSLLQLQTLNPSWRR